MTSLVKVFGDLKDKHFDSFIVTSPINILYLSGFQGLSQTEREAILIVSKKSTLITSMLYREEAMKLQEKNLDVFIASEGKEIKNKIKELLKPHKKVAFESLNLTYHQHKEYERLIGKKIKPQKDIVEKLRSIKEKEEISKIRTAQVISQKSFLDLTKTLKVGQTETEIAEKLSTIIKINRGEGESFPAIVASGPNSGLPHYKTGNRKLTKNDILLLDFGAKYQNYCADLSRVIFVGKPKDEVRNIFGLVYKAQSEGVKAVKNNSIAKSINQAANKVFKAQKLEDHFIHSLGHGIGLEVHEKPSISKKSKDQLKDGMVFSIEPGLYFDWGGVRIEDLVTVTKTGAQIIGKRAPFITI